MLPPQKMSMRDLAQDDLVDFLRWAVPELSGFSNITCQQMLLGAQAINLNPRNSENQPVELGYLKKPSLDFKDPTKLGMVFVLKGKCRIYWEVKKYRERHATIYADDETQDSDNPDAQGGDNLFSTQTH